jgi:hypothetical protein
VAELRSSTGTWLIATGAIAKVASATPINLVISKGKRNRR